jgi:ATP-dependent RNA helicase DBP3
VKKKIIFSFFFFFTMSPTPADSTTRHSKKKRKQKEKENVERKKVKVETTETEDYYKIHQIRVTGVNAETYHPYTRFEQAPFDTSLSDYFKDFQSPTPIQAACWPPLLDGRDVVGIAETGSGKTLAFALPGIMHLLERRQKEKKKKYQPWMLILTPTRELAIQIHETLNRPIIRSVCLYGGVAKEEQRKGLRKADIIVATPGRLQDLLDDGSCQLSQVSYVVLDEADRMLDIGFEVAVRKILSHCPKQRQTVMFSATWPTSVRQLADTFMDKDQVIRIAIGGRDDEHAHLTASQHIHQIVQVLSDDPREKDIQLQRLLSTYHKSRKNRILIFALYKKEAIRLEQQLLRKGWKVQAIHGDKNQQQRMNALNDFKSGACPLLVATDVAARGLDIPNVEYVINYTFPLTIEDYIHRIGRTGRAGHQGIAHTFFTSREKSLAGALQNVLRQSNQEIPEDLRKFGNTVKKKEHASYGAFYREIDPTVKATKIIFDDDD